MNKKINDLLSQAYSISKLIQIKPGTPLGISITLRQSGCQLWPLTFRRPYLALLWLYHLSIRLGLHSHPLIVNATWPPEAYGHFFTSNLSYLRHKPQQSIQCYVLYLPELVFSRVDHAVGVESPIPKSQLMGSCFFGMQKEFPCGGWDLWTREIKEFSLLYFWIA